MTTTGIPQHVTLTANTVTTLTFAGNWGRIEVLSLDGVAEVYFTTDGSDPVVGGTGCHAVPAVISAVEVPDDTAGQGSVVKLISTGTPKVSVRGL